MGIHTAARTTKRWLRELFTPSCAHDGSACRRRESLFDKHPVDIIHHIHSLLPVRDAARAACVCREFLCSWRCYTNLTLNVETIGLTGKKYDDREIFLIHIVDHILKNYFRNGVEIFILDLELLSCHNIDASYLDRWLQIAALRPGIKELKLLLSLSMKKKYIFPCSVLSNYEAAASSIRSLDLYACAFGPTTALGCLSRLETLYLRSVDITDEGLGHLLSKSFCWGQIYIINCSKIICLKIPCMLQQLKVLTVTWCGRLQAVDTNAPNLSTLHFIGTLVEISVADPSQLQDVYLLGSTHSLSYARAKLPSIAPNVKTLSLMSLHEVGQNTLRPNDSVVGGDNANYQRWKAQCRNDRLRQVTITGFCSAENLVQFVIYILESTPFLECLTLDTTPRSNGSVRPQVARALAWGVAENSFVDCIYSTTL